MIETPLNEIEIEYPRVEETIPSGPYSFRIRAQADAREVRLCIDDGPWQSCRADGGHWWFDWSSSTSGEHIAVSRVIKNDGSVILGQPHPFRVQRA